jgi:hypothetical protein
MLLPFTLVLFALHSHVSANVLLPRQTSSPNSSTSRTASITTSTLSPSSSISADCCAIFASQVALDFWYNGSVEVILATVITQLIRYDNTVLTSLITVKNNASTSSGAWTTGDYDVGAVTIPGVPTDLVVYDEDGYDKTIVATGTALTWKGTIVFVILSAIYRFMFC